MTANCTSRHASTGPRTVSDASLARYRLACD